MKGTTETINQIKQCSTLEGARREQWRIRPRTARKAVERGRLSLTGIPHERWRRWR
jgi:hypothetical protein